ncbi:uncharacterized protein YceK [Sphingomonas jejuensis]|uniref:Uncharacterized protein YceK n=1 Tax=Sphingomonas jejuensis TaxID=904715 RepID=A0ABX0XPK8_9SPHN|nr:hypothetical protein [Sphingomonas jejuensis]NJC34792.1 uncharacterized protein YceK [Sphingomonas jejuensis]
MKQAMILLVLGLLTSGCDTARDRVEANDAAAETTAVVTNQAPAEPAPR